MPEYKATLRYTISSECWLEAEDETAARAKLEALTVPELRQATQWRDLFVEISDQTVIGIEKP